MIQNKLLFEKKVLIFVIVLFALIASLNVVGYFSSVKKTPLVAVQSTEEPTITPTPTLEPTVTMMPDINVSEWKTYRNEEVGIEFEYPTAILGDAENSYSDNSGYPGSAVDGKIINISFKKMGVDTSWINLAFSGYENKNIDSECLKPLTYNGRGEACKFVEVAGQKAIWGNSAFKEECFFSLSNSIYFNNKNLSQYKRLTLSFFLEDATTKIDELYNCADDKKVNDAYSEAVVQSKNIMERKNLSEKDLQRLDIVDRILASFKFIQ